ncbi:MAG: TIR domain-containing protein [Anaerolineales bacterium]|jgi:hypothetical protein|nr:TIR domain-containing protein [Chloroflexota bacterium]MBK6645944.1 TIR domain-containing protein [Anaerolineales bacterium]
MNKRPLKVFLCHASSDKPAVRILYKRLVDDKVNAWLDVENLVAGQNWQVAIPEAIRNSDVVVVCLSEKSINKEGYVQREIKFALDIADEKPEGTIFIIPARLENCKVPERLSLYHWVELFREDGYDKLMRALSARAEKIGVIKPVLGSRKKNLFFQPPNNSRKVIFGAVISVGLIAALVIGIVSFFDNSIKDSIPTQTAVSTTPVLVPASETQAKTEISPTATETNTPTATFTPSVTPTFTVTATPTPFGFEIISISAVAYRGGKAGAEIKTQPGAVCALGYILPTGGLSGAAGTGPDTADQNGICSWEWTISRFTNPGWGNIYIEAGGKNESYPIEIR